MATFFKNHARALIAGLVFALVWAGLALGLVLLGAPTTARSAPPQWFLPTATTAVICGYYPALIALAFWHAQPRTSGFGAAVGWGALTGLVPMLPVIATWLVVLAVANSGSSTPETGDVNIFFPLLFLYPVPLAGALGGLLRGLGTRLDARA